MAAPTKMAAISIQDTEHNNQVAADTNTTKPLNSSQELGRTAGSVVQNSRMDSGAVTRSKMPPTAPTKTTVTAPRGKAVNNEAVGGNNKTKPLNSIQEPTKTAGRLARNNKMDSVGVSHGKTPPSAPVGVATSQQNTKNIGENLVNLPTKTHHSSQESGILDGSMVRNENMRSTPSSIHQATAAASFPRQGTAAGVQDAATHLAGKVPQLKEGATSLQRALQDHLTQFSGGSRQQHDKQNSNSQGKQQVGSAMATATVKATADGTATAVLTATVPASGNRSTGSGRGRGRGDGLGGRGRGGRGDAARG
jgi:hypothetical protein